MMASFNFIDCDSAITKLQELKKENKNISITIHTFDFDNDEVSRKVTTPDEGCILVRKSKTVIYNEDEFVPHMELFSMVQNDIENILKKGILHDIIIPHRRE